MKNKLWAAILVAASILSASYVFSAEQSNLDNLSFAEFLKGELNISVPGENEDLPRSKYYNSLADALSTAGISNFQNTMYDTEVTFGELAEVLFALVKGAGNPDTAGKIDYLVNNGYLKEKSSPEMIMTMAELEKIFNNPKLTGLIAQTYVSPEVRAERMPGSYAPGAAPELPASGI